MRFPNAHEGVKKIFIAEVIGLIAAALLLISAIVSVFMVGTAKNLSDVGGSVIVTLLTVLSSVILAIVAFIFRILGISSAMKDETVKFKYAFYCVFVSLGAAILQAIISFFNSKVAEVFEVIAAVAGLLVTLYIILGIVELAKTLGNGAMEKKGKTLYYIIFGFYCVEIIFDILLVIFKKDIDTLIMASIFSLVKLLFSVVKYVLYLIYLKEAEKMLTAPADINTDQTVRTL